MLIPMIELVWYGTQYNLCRGIVPVHHGGNEIVVTKDNLCSDYEQNDLKISTELNLDPRYGL